MEAFVSNLTSDDLIEWAGAKIFSRGKSYIRNVAGLSRTEDGALAAWVSGSDEYATSVGQDPDGELEYVCTCPYDDGPCKHAVAVVLAAAEYVKRKRDIPLLAEDDDLYLALFDDSDDDYVDDYDDGGCLEEYEDTASDKTIAAAHRKGTPRVAKILEEMSKDALVAMIVELTSRYPEIERGLLEREQLVTGRVDKLISAVRREIRALTAEPVYYDRWRGGGPLPDYTHVHEQFDALLAAGHADAVLELGEELWSLGNDQVEQSRDEGQTASAIAECMEVVLRAVPRTSLAPPDQLLWLIDRMLSDEYSLLDGSADRALEGAGYTREHWLEVADILETRLKSTARHASAEFSAACRRRALMGMLIVAHERSGRVPLLCHPGGRAPCRGEAGTSAAVVHRWLSAHHQKRSRYRRRSAEAAPGDGGNGGKPRDGRRLPSGRVL